LSRDGPLVNDTARCSPDGFQRREFPLAKLIWLYIHMVMYKSLDSKFAALADPTRRAILARLALGEATVNELRAPFARSQPAISKHLKVLEKAGLIDKGQAAQSRPRRLNAVALKETTDWIAWVDTLWRDSFDRLEEFLAANPDTTTPKEA
jgi:DNA-binding transcriptional ArsR family regulator